MGDSEYVAAFQRIIMPIAYEYNPELVIVSAGFDAMVGDPIGHYSVTPEAYGYFTHWLSTLANGNIILCLEGGYNVNSISHAMAMCAKALLGDPLPVISPTKTPNTSCIETIQNVLSVQQKYWKSLRFHKKLPSFDALTNSYRSVDDITENFGVLTCSDSSKQSAGDSNSNTKKNDDQQPGTSSAGSSNPKKQTFNEFLDEIGDALLSGDMFLKRPRSDCPHLVTLDANSTPNGNIILKERHYLNLINVVFFFSISAINTKSLCQKCDPTTEKRVENWICLLCFETYCSRFIQEHMLFHHLETDHALALSYSDLSVWCFKCDDYIDNPILYKYKNLAHRDKFGEDLTWTYGEITLETENDTNAPCSSSSKKV